MDCKPTSISRQRARCRAFTLTELLVGFGVGSLVLVVVATLAFDGTRNFALMWNYAGMDAQSDSTADQLSRDARRSNKVTSCSSNSLTLEDSDGVTLTYTYSPSALTLTRAKSGVTSVLLSECDAFNFTMSKRNPGGAFESFPAATAAEAKIVEATWKSSRTILGQKSTTKNMSTAKIVIRRQGP